MAVPPSLPMLTLGSWPVVSGRWADSFDAQAVKPQWHFLPSHQAARQRTFLNHSTARAPYRILLNVNLPGWHMTASNHPRRHGVIEAQCPMHSRAAATHYEMRRRRTVWGRFGTMEDPRFGTCPSSRRRPLSWKTSHLLSWDQPHFNPLTQRLSWQWHTVRSRHGNDAWSHPQRPEVRSV